MPRLLALKPGTRIVSHDGGIGDWPPDERLEMRTPEKPVGVGGVSRVELWIVPADAKGAWTSEIPAHGGKWNFRIKQHFQMLDVDVGAQGRDLLVRNTRLRGEEIKLIVTGIVNGRAWHHYFVGTLQGRAHRRRAHRLGRQQQEELSLDGNKSAVAPRELLSVPDGIFLVTGMVIGVGIFKLPGLVAGNAASAGEFFVAWIVGGIACLCGALVYAELASRYPETGGEYAFLRRGFGEGAAFVFAWSRMTVIQTGAIAAVSFVFGDYASQIVSFGAQSNAIWAAICVAVLTGPQPARHAAVQEAAEGDGDPADRGAGGDRDRRHRHRRHAGGARAKAGSSSFALMMIFVLYTFGGWNEGAYLAGEVRDARRNMVKVLVGGIFW